MKVWINRPGMGGMCTAHVRQENVSLMYRAYGWQAGMVVVNGDAYELTERQADTRECEGLLQTLDWECRPAGGSMRLVRHGIADLKPVFSNPSL